MKAPPEGKFWKVFWRATCKHSSQRISSFLNVSLRIIPLTCSKAYRSQNILSGSTFIYTFFSSLKCYPFSLPSPSKGDLALLYTRWARHPGIQANDKNMSAGKYISFSEINHVLFTQAKESLKYPLSPCLTALRRPARTLKARGFLSRSSVSHCGDWDMWTAEQVGHGFPEVIG